MGYGVTSIVYASRPTGPGRITGANQILLIFGKVLDESTGNLTGNEILLWRGKTESSGNSDPAAISVTEWESGSWNATFEEGDTATGSQTTQTPVDTSTASVSAHIVKNSVLTFEYAAPGGSSELYRVRLTNYVFYTSEMMREPAIAVDIVDYVPAEVGIHDNREVQASAEYDKVASYRRAVIYEYVHIESFDVQLTGPKQFTATFSGTVYLVNTQDISARVDLRLYAKELDGETIAESTIYTLSPSYGTASGGSVPFSGSLVLTDNAGLIGYDLAKKYRFYADATIDSEIVYETETLERWTQRKLTSPVIDGMSALDGVGSVRWGAVENAAGYLIALVDSKTATPVSSSAATSPWNFNETGSGTVVQGKYVRLQSVAVSTQYEYANSDWSEGVLIPDNRTPDDPGEEPITPVEQIMTRRIYKAIPYIDVPVEQIGGGGSSAKDVITVEYADSHYAALGDAITPSTLPIATGNELGAIKVGSHLSINDETGVLSVSDSGAIAIGNTGLVTGGTVYAETNKYAAFANKSIATSVADNNTNPVTSGAVYTFVTTVSNLPKAKATGGSSNAGVVYVTSASDKEGLIIDGTNDGQIKVDFATYSSWSSTVANKVANPSYVKQAIEGYVADAMKVTATGGSGKGGMIVKLNGDGFIDGSMLKVVSVTNYFEAASESAMLALSDAQDGDICVRTDEHKTYILMSDGAENGYATASNWKELTAPTGTVTSVNGKAGAAVTLNLTDIYANESTKASIDVSISADAISTENYHFPTSKAVQGYVTSKITALNLGGAATYSVATWTSGTTHWNTGGTGLVTADYLDNAFDDYGFGAAAKKGVATSVGTSTDLITASAVNTAISGLTYSDVGAAAASHTHPIGEITYTISSTNYTGAISASISSSSTHGGIPTAKAVYDYKPFVNRIIAGTSGTTTFSGVTTSLATTISSETYSIPTAYAVQQALNGKAASSHNQAITTIYATGTTAFAGIVTDYSTYTANAEDYKVPTAYAVKTALAGKANSTHTHTSAQISDAIDAVADPEASASFGKVVKTESDWGQISATLIPIDEDSIVNVTGALQVSTTWFASTGDNRYLKKSDAPTQYVKMVNTGAAAWASGVSYEVGDLVYNSSGVLWRCVQANTSTAANGPDGLANLDSGSNYVYWIPAKLAVDKRVEKTITGNGSTTEFTVTHGLGTKDVDVSLIDDSTDQEVFAAVTMYSTTQVKIGFGAAPASGKVYRVVVRK